MVTTNRMIPIDAFASDPPELVHLTGFCQVLARVTMGGADDLPAHVELCFDASRVRGVGLKTGARYAARGGYRLIDDLAEPSVPVRLVGTFEILRHGVGDGPAPRLLLAVPFQVAIQNDGRVRVDIDNPRLLPCPGG